MFNPFFKASKCVFTLFSILVLVSSPPSLAQKVPADGDQPQIELANPGFDDGEPGEAISGWFASSLEGSRSAISDENPKVGKLCASMRLNHDANSKRFAVLSQPIDAAPYQGKRVRFRAAVRVEGNETFRAHLWFRVDRADRVTGAFDNMADRPIQSDTWQYYDIVGDVEPDAKQIMLGMHVSGQGEGFFDDVSFTVVGNEVATTAKPLNLPPLAAKRESPNRTAPKRIPLHEIGPGLFEIRGANEVSKSPRFRRNNANVDEVTFLFPLPLSYRDQVPLSWELTVVPADSMKSVEVYHVRKHNYVAKVMLKSVSVKGKVDVNFRSTVLVGPSVFDGVPERAPMPADWPQEAKAWLAPTSVRDLRQQTHRRNRRRDSPRGR